MLALSPVRVRSCVQCTTSWFRHRPSITTPPVNAIKNKKRFNTTQAARQGIKVALPQKIRVGGRDQQLFLQVLELAGAGAWKTGIIGMAATRFGAHLISVEVTRSLAPLVVLLFALVRSFIVKPRNIFLRQPALLSLLSPLLSLLSLSQRRRKYALHMVFVPVPVSSLFRNFLLPQRTVLVTNISSHYSSF